MKYIFLTTIAFGIARFTVPITEDDIFKDVAHCFVGGLYGAAILATVVRLQWKHFLESLPVDCPQLFLVQNAWLQATYRSRRLWALAIGLTILEVVAFILLKSS